MVSRVEVSLKVLPSTTAHSSQRAVEPMQALDVTSRATGPKTIPVKLLKSTDGIRPMLMAKSTPKPLRIDNAPRRVMIRPVSSEAMNNPAYAAYNEIVRSRIEQKIYDNYDKSQMGNVYLTFIVDSKGELTASQVIESKTTADRHLQSISLTSLRQAAPFPPFIKGMNLPEYSFNIEVQYQLHD